MFLLKSRCLTPWEWPTLKEMLDSTKLVVVFMELSRIYSNNLPLSTTHLLDEYNPTDPKFPCKVERSAGPLKPPSSSTNQNVNFNVIPIGHGLRYVEVKYQYLRNF
jgi:hypothetical protein